MAHTHKSSGKSGHKSKSHKTTEHKSRSHHTSKHHTSKHTSKSQHHHSGKSRSHGTTTTHRDGHTTTTRREEEHNQQKGFSTSLGPGVADPFLLAFLVILGISAIILFAIGVWLLSRRAGWPVGLNLTGNRGWTRFLSYGTAAILLFFLFIFIIIFSFLGASTKRGASARINRLLVVFFASLAFLILFLMTFNAIFFAADSPGFISDIIREGWKNTVTDFSRLTACRIQDRYDCEGWEDGSCNDCEPTIDGDYEDCTDEQRLLCPRCFQASDERRRLVVSALTIFGARQDETSKRRPVNLGPFIRPRVRSGNTNNSRPSPTPVARQRNDKPGCKNPVQRAYRRFFIPMSVYTIFLALIIVLLTWKACIDSSGRW